MKTNVFHIQDLIVREGQRSDVAEFIEIKITLISEFSKTLVSQTEDRQVFYFFKID